MEVKNVVYVSSCTSGLMLVERYLGLKGEVIVPSFTFPATVYSLVWNNLNAYREYYQEYKDKLPVTEWLCERILCLPLFSHMSEDTVKYICDTIEIIHSQNRKSIEVKQGV